MSIFAWCAIIGCATLLAGILLDGVLDAFLPDGMVPVLALPVAVFGAIGMAMTAVSGPAAQVPAAVVWGVPQHWPSPPARSHADCGTVSGAPCRWTRLRPPPRSWSVRR